MSRTGIKDLKFDKKCYNCEVEYLDDECSLEPERCNSCRINGVYTKFKVNIWGLLNNQLDYTSGRED